VRILAFRSINHLIVPDVRAALADARSALQRAERVGDPALLARAIARVGTTEVHAVDITPGLLERGAEIEERLGLQLEYYESPQNSLTRLLGRLGEIDRSRAILQRLEREAAARGDELLHGSVIFNLSHLEWIVGDLRRALEYADAGRELAEQIQSPGCSGRSGG
jgi:hypothetical protein